MAEAKDSTVKIGRELVNVNLYTIMYVAVSNAMAFHASLKAPIDPPIEHIEGTGFTGRRTIHVASQFHQIL